MDHVTDIIIEVHGSDLKEAFTVTANAVINVTLEQEKVEEKSYKVIVAKDKDLSYLLFSWIEEIVFVLITEGFAIRRMEVEISEGEEYTINAKAYGEPLNFVKHNFKVEIKAPTFYDMQIKKNDTVYMKFLLDL